jgi:23S rRNA (cytosine1962-C5)-methyltransferase
MLAQNPTGGIQTLIPTWADYALLDTGAGKKLERFGEFTLVRPEPQAKWSPTLPSERWDAADGEFVRPKPNQPGRWKFRRVIPGRWQMRRKSLTFWVQPAPSGHVGVFPDQACHWDWLDETITRVAPPVKVLCLFAHTGLATLAAAAAGAEVTHVDASRKAVTWARENQALSGLGERPIRWIVEDALTFVQREARRAHRYDALMLDPPRFGRGPSGQLWKLDDALPELLAACAKLLSASPAFVLLNVYTTVLTQSRIEQDAATLRSSLQAMLAAVRTSGSAGLPAGQPRGLPAITTGQLALEDAGQRKISASLFARAEWAYI